MDWNTYYTRFYDWEERTRLRHLSTLTDFGTSSQICELANEFYESNSADRLIRKALNAGIRFTSEDVLELDGVVSKNLMPPLIQSIPILTAEELDDLSFWLTAEELQTVAAKHRIPLHKDGYVITAEMEALEQEILREEEEIRLEEELLEQELAQERAAQSAQREFLLTFLLWQSLHSRRRRREHRKKKHNK